MAWAAWSDRGAGIAAETSQNELLARVLEEQVTRDIENAATALATLAELPGVAEAAQRPGQVNPALSQMLLGMPFIRAMAVLDRQGRVLDATQPAELGLVIEMQRLGPWPSAGRDAIGPFVPTRGLSGLQRGNTARTPPGVGFIPILRTVSNGTAPPTLLVALVNPDSFANYQRQTLGDAGRRAVVASYAGMVLASSTDMPALAGRSVGNLPVFRHFLPEREFASYVGKGTGGDAQIVAFRVSRTRPIVVLVELPMNAALAHWFDSVKGFAVAGAVALALILGLTLTVWRSLRARESARRLTFEAQARVTRSEHELAVLMKSVQELIFRTDAAGLITFVNARWLALRGTDVRSAIGHALHDIVEPDSRQAVRALFRKEGQEGVRTAQARLCTADGTALRFDVAVVPLLSQGVLVGYAGSAVDVTERWNAEHQLQTQLALNAQLLELNPLPIAMTDIRGRLLLVNRAWEEFEGVPRGDAIGRSLAMVVDKAQARMHEEADRRLMTQGGSTRFETRLRARGSSWRDTRVLKALVPDGDGNASGILSVLMDISEFREAERATREAHDAAEEAARAKTEFVSNMSHELRTPLQSIIGFSELGKTRVRDPARQSAMFEDIHAAGQRMLALVNDLLDVAKIESSVGTFHLERIDLRGTVRGVLREMEPLVLAKRLELRLALPDVPLIGKADPARFQQVIRNVIANAVKFSPADGVITVSGEVSEDHDLHFCVRDQGPGIPADEIDRIFDAFVQSSATKDGSGGTGLGLAICRKIVELHGGRIYAQSLPGGGSAFHIHMPMRASLAETVPAAL
ncbi:hypothetical protein RD110_08570 [Rhodoferax koreense]|uniref:histidine kinase n=1 Tax=Rhodoferax koreensis TaxID=1842727 RepID=A0A1P8K3I2_9BURK|nr:hypothetical protein RD110_08570 [Rhodoferax koreense]